MEKIKFKKREFLVLAAVVLFGVGGLMVLQWSRRNAAARREDRALLQAKAQAGQADPEANRTYQRVPGNLITTNENPEQYKPFLFRMENFSQGAVYELDFGDGTGRKPFVNGIIKHVYRRKGPHQVSLYAKYEGQEVQLQTITKIVAPAKENIEIAPGVDY